MAEPAPAPAPKPIERIENYDLLQTDLGAYILKETGIDISAHNPTERPTFSAADLALDPLSVLSHGFSNSLSTNILEGKATHLFPAVVALAFKNGPDGVQACKAVAPILHGAGENPFRLNDEFERAEMRSHFPTFSFTDGLTAGSSPIVPGSIILVSFDNPHNYWTSGVIEKVVKGRPDALPEYADLITGARDLFDNLALFASGALSLLMDSNFTPKQKTYNGQTIENGKLSDALLTNVDTTYSKSGRVITAAAADFNAMAQAFNLKFGVKFPLGEGYRLFSTQVKIWNDPKKVNKAGKKLGAKPGTSNHGWGVAIDWNTRDPEGGYGYDSKYYKWMLNNQAYFVNPSWAIKGGSKEEPWHWEWVGKGAAGL